MTQDMAEPTPVIRQAQDHPSEEGELFIPSSEGKRKRVLQTDLNAGHVSSLCRVSGGVGSVLATPQTRTVPLRKEFSE